MKPYTSKIIHTRFPDTIDGQILALKDNDQIKDYRLYRDSVKDEPFNPSYHFYAPDGRINDPNGLCYWNGQYHLFYQAYPPKDCRQHWGHAISEDMVHWKDLPLAIYPDIEQACYSGSSITEENRVIAIYHGLGVGNMIATSSDPFLLNWEKNENCPVIPIMPDSETGKPYRVFDPFIWKEKEGYYALSGSYYGKEGERLTGTDNQMAVHLFFSQNLSYWTYIGELADTYPQMELGHDGACPYFWPLGDQFAFFFFSHQSGPYCLTGSYDKTIHKFVPKKKYRFDYGPVGCSNLHAPCAMPDNNGGLYLIFNTKDGDRSLQRQGAMTIMRHVTMGDDGKITMSPIPQIDTLHSECYEEETRLLPAFQPQIIGQGGKELDIQFTLDLCTSRTVSIQVFSSPDKREHTDINIYRSIVIRDGMKKTFYYMAIDTTHSSLSPSVEGRNPEVAEIEADSEKMDVRILLDRCILEVFVNGKTSLTQMVYPTLTESKYIVMEALGNDAVIKNFKMWKMNGIY